MSHLSCLSLKLYVFFCCCCCCCLSLFLCCCCWTICKCSGENLSVSNTMFVSPNTYANLALGFPGTWFMKLIWRIKVSFYLKWSICQFFNTRSQILLTPYIGKLFLSCSYFAVNFFSPILRCLFDHLSLLNFHEWTGVHRAGVLRQRDRVLAQTEGEQAANLLAKTDECRTDNVQAADST